jgi:hypothetical protein
MRFISDGAVQDMLGTKGERRANEMILLEINLFAMILLRARL